MKLSIIIVNYNTYTLTKQTIDSVLDKSLNFDYEIMLVDNASHDGSIEALESDYTSYIEQGIIRFFKNKENLGFSKANNIGMRHAKGEYMLLLNSDTYVIDDVLEKSIAYIENAQQGQIGALGCKIIYDFHEAMWRFYKKYYYKKYNKLISGLVYVGIWTKYSIAILQNSMKPKVVQDQGVTIEQ